MSVKNDSRLTSIPKHGRSTATSTNTGKLSSYGCPMEGLCINTPFKLRWYERQYVRVRMLTAIISYQRFITSIWLIAPAFIRCYIKHSHHVKLICLGSLSISIEYACIVDSHNAVSHQYKLQSTKSMLTQKKIRIKSHNFISSVYIDIDFVLIYT